MRKFAFFISLLVVALAGAGYKNPARAAGAYEVGPAWTANWVWDAGEATPHNFYLYLRKEVELPTAAVTANVRVTADSRYILYVNGTMVGRGPVKSDRRWLYYDEWDIKPLLKPGKNVIAALAHHYGEWTFSYMLGRGGFILEGDIETKGGKHVAVVTDKTWKVKAGDAWFRGLQRMSIQQGFPEVYDARKEPAGWKGADFDASDWQNATELGRPPVQPWPRLVKRMTRPQTGGTIYPVKLIDTGDAVPGPRNEGVDFTQNITGEDNAAAYAATYVYSPKDAKASLVLTTKNACKLYVNGKTLISNYIAAGIDLDNTKRYVDLRAGWTPLLVKCVKNVPAWGFSIAVDAPERNEFVFSYDKSAENTGWSVIGPFRRNGKTESEYKKEYISSKDYDLTKSYDGGGGKDVTWKVVTGTEQMTTRLAAALGEMETRPLTDGRIEDKSAICAAKPCFSYEVQTKQGGAVYFVFDFGRETAGFTRIALNSAAGGEIVDVGYSELLEDNSGNALAPAEGKAGRVNPGKSGVNYADRYITRAGKQEFIPFNRHAFRYMLVVVRNAEKPLSIDSVSLDLSVYDAGNRGSFVSASDVLNRIWDIGGYTVLLNMDDSYTDCPWRERGEWWGDARVEALVNYYAFGDLGLVRRGILQIGESQRDDGLVAGIYPTDWDNRWLPDYALIWVSSVKDYYDYSGDASVLPELLPRFEKMFDGFFAWHEAANNLLTDVPHWVFIDWAPVEKRGAITALNAFYYKALRDAAELARVGGDGAAAKKYDAKADAVKQAINANLWSAERGAYADCLFEGRICGTVSRQANSLAVLYDIAPAEKQLGIMKMMMDPKSNIVREGSPYFSHYVLEAIRHAGMDDEAMKYIGRWKEMLDWGATSWWEVWNTGSSLCHGWSAAPTFDLSKYVLGVSPAAPGFSRVRIEPPRTGGEDLTFASGVVPTPHGDVKVRWDRGDGQLTFDLRVTVPEGVTVEAWLPKGNAIAPRLRVDRSWTLPDGMNKLTGRDCCLGVEITKAGEYHIALIGGPK